MIAPAAATPQADRDVTLVRKVIAQRKRVLDPVERFSEIIFGLVMVLTFTGSLAVAESGREEVRAMLVAAVGCNIAWGIVDAVMYAVTSVVERSRRAAVMRAIRAAPPEEARKLVLAVLPEGVAAVADEADAERLAARARALPEPPRGGLRGEDLAGALASGLLVILATFPPTIPFIFVEDAARALRISNGVAVGCLFLAGFSLGRATGVRPFVLGAAMVLLGSALVGLTIALGG
jgi:hypothetical protein